MVFIYLISLVVLVVFGDEIQTEIVPTEPTERNIVPVPIELYNIMIKKLGEPQQELRCDNTALNERLLALSERMDTFEDVRKTLLNYFIRIATIQNRLTELEAVKDSIYKSVEEMKSTVQADNINLRSEMTEIAKMQKESLENVSNIRESVEQQLDTIREDVSVSFSKLSANVSDFDIKFKIFEQEMVSDISNVNITAYDTSSQIDVFRSDLENRSAEFQDFRSSDFQDLKHNLRILQNQSNTCTAIEQVSDIKEEIRNESLVVESLKTDVASLIHKHVTHPRISFTVKVHTDLKNLGSDQPIEFTEVISQEGNSYDTRTGIFTCPVAGTYLFSASLMNNLPNVQIIIAYISKNKADSVPIHCQGTHGEYNMCSATLITHLVDGDKVWVKHKSGGETDNFSTFAGILIQSG